MEVKKSRTLKAFKNAFCKLKLDSYLPTSELTELLSTRLKNLPDADPEP
jgi:hypothetical protein